MNLLSFLPANVRLLLPEIAGCFTTSIAAITARQEQIEWLFRLGASAVGMIVGLLTIRSLLTKHPLGASTPTDEPAKPMNPRTSSPKRPPYWRRRG